MDHESRIQRELLEKAPGEDVKARYEFEDSTMVEPRLGGYWIWNESRQCHERKSLDQIQASLPEGTSLTLFLEKMREVYVFLY